MTTQPTEQGALDLLRTVNRAVKLLRAISESATQPDEAWIPALYLARMAGHLTALADELDALVQADLPAIVREGSER